MIAAVLVFAIAGCVVLVARGVVRSLSKVGGADLGHPVSPGDENALLGRDTTKG